MSDTPNDLTKVESVQVTPVKRVPLLGMSDDPLQVLEKAGYPADNMSSPLMRVINQATGSATKKAPQLAFSTLPQPQDNYLGLYKTQRRLLPDSVKKEIRMQCHLVAAILRGRGGMMSLFGHLKKDRFDVGVELALKQEFYDILTPEQYEKVMERMKKAERLLLNCGHTAGLEHHDRLSLAQYIDIQIQNGLCFGRFATEMIYDRDVEPDADGNYPFNRFRPRDVSTMMIPVRKGEYIGNNLREAAMAMLESISGEKPKIDINRLREDQYAWIQVIEGMPRQAFTHREMLVCDLFPTTDIEKNGYPVSPLDTIIRSVTTHISIDAYEELYFQNGRATRGMLVIKSDEIDRALMDNMQMQFNASINSVSNSFRTPIFGMGKDDAVDWLPFNGEGLQDNQFNYLYDSIARNIMSAFSMSPDELPGYNHLSKGTNSQTLSECMHPDTKIITPEGLKSIGSMLTEQDAISTPLWNGLRWVESKVFKTGSKSIKETVLDNKLSIKTSPDHRFYVIGESGEPEWKTQAELNIGDYVLNNKQIVEGIGEIPKYNGRSSNITQIKATEWLEQCHLNRVEQLIDHNDTIEMVDVTVFDDNHAFVANGIIVHNSNNEFKLTAARDTGFRPLVLKLQTFLNQQLFPIIDPLLAKICEIKFCGLDAQSKEQESSRLQQDMPTYLSMDEVLHQVDKRPIGKSFGGEVPFNERWQLLTDKYLNTGDLIGHFLGSAAAIVDPMLRYKRDPFSLQHVQLLSQINPSAVQAYFAPRPYAMDLLKMLVQDDLDMDENND